MKETIMVTASGVALELVDGHFQSENMEEVINALQEDAIGDDPFAAFMARRILFAMMQQIQSRIEVSIKTTIKCQCI